MTRRQLLRGIPFLPVAAVAALASLHTPGLPVTSGPGMVVTSEIWNEVIRTVNKANGRTTPIRDPYTIFRKGA